MGLFSKRNLEGRRYREESEVKQPTKLGREKG